MNSGLRMCGWGADDVKYFMIGHPLITWFSTGSLLIVSLYLIVVLCMWQRQSLKLNILDPYYEFLLSGAILPLIGWVLHYFPFVMMGRVTYLHHYVPALYFAIFVAGFMMEALVARKVNKYLTGFIYLCFYIAIIAIFWYLKDLVLGMEGPSRNFRHLRVLSSWMV